jgi:type I restriction enzyme R subunit
VVEGVIQNIDVLKELFASLMRHTAPAYLPLAQGWDDKAKERAIDHFSDKAGREEFFKFFRQVQSLYDIISPDAFLRPYLENYQALAELYQFIRLAYSDRVYVDKELTAKTRELLRQHTLSGQLELPGQIYEIGPRALAAIKESRASYTTKVLNLSKLIARLVDEEGQQKPFLIPIGERAARLIDAWEDRQATTQQTLAGFEELMEEYLRSDAESQQLGLDANTFAIYKTLHPLADSLTAAQAQAVNALFAKYPDYEWSAQHADQLRAELYGLLRPLVGPAKMIAAANVLLELQRV